MMSIFFRNSRARAAMVSLRPSLERTHDERHTFQTLLQPSLDIWNAEHSTLPNPANSVPMVYEGRYATQCVLARETLRSLDLNPLYLRPSRYRLQQTAAQFGKLVKHPRLDVQMHFILQVDFTAMKAVDTPYRTPGETISAHVAQLVAAVETEGWRVRFI